MQHLETPLRGACYYDTHLTDEETEALGGKVAEQVLGIGCTRMEQSVLPTSSGASSLLS